MQRPMWVLATPLRLIEMEKMPLTESSTPVGARPDGALYSQTISWRSLGYIVALFLIARILLSAWALAVQSLSPLPAEADEQLRPYVGADRLVGGVSGLLLGPWQRFDTMCYLYLAREGYDAQHSVFPPLYPLGMRAVGTVFEAATPLDQDAANLLGGILLSNAALLAALVLLYHVTAVELDEAAAMRTLVYLVIFPVGFFLFAAYTESLFLLFALGALWAARRNRPLWAGALGLFASLTRLTGWVLFVPLLYEYLRHRNFAWRRIDWGILPALLPPAASLAFMLWRTAAGFPPLSQVYREFWYQTTGMPGADVLVAFRSIVTGAGPRAGEFTLVLDLFVLFLLISTTYIVLRRLGVVYGLYGAMLLLFMLLPTSEFKPLFSFSRYALAFFPSFMILGRAGHNPWVNRAILYPSVALLLYFSGQFFIWGWVA